MELLKNKIYSYILKQSRTTVTVIYLNFFIKLTKSYQKWEVWTYMFKNVQTLNE